jgi:hypothetical protein
MSKVRRRLSRELVARQPYERWNAFIDLVATEDATRLTATQRAAQLAFWYDSEVQNGGHLQYAVTPCVVPVLGGRGPWSEARAAQPENGRSDSARRVRTL